MSTTKTTPLETIVGRIMSKVVYDFGCWTWRSPSTTGNGYGLINHDGKMRLVHRVMFTAENGAIPEGAHIDHLCRNTFCCNPTHLEPVTQAENNRRSEAWRWQTRKTHCPHGHEYTPENTYVYKSRRNCRTCIAARNRSRGVA